MYYTHLPYPTDVGLLVGSHNLPTLWYNDLVALAHQPSAGGYDVALSSA